MPTPPSPVSGGLSAAEEFVCDVALTLHRAGAPAHRLENVVSVLAERLGIEARVFSTPTAIYAGFGAIREARTSLIRTDGGALDLGRLDAVDDLIRRIVSGEIEPAQAGALLEEVIARPRRYPLAAVLPAFAGTSSAVAVLFGGGLVEVIASAAAGLAVGAVVEALSQRPGVATLADLVGAAASGLVAGLLARIAWPMDVGLVTVAGIIALVPGLSLTTAMTELGSRHLASGTARMGGVLAVFASLALGSVAGSSFWLWWPSSATSFIPLPGWTALIALLVAVPGFTILLQARLRDMHVIGVAAIAGYAVAYWLGGIVPSPFDAAAGALTVGLLAHGLSRLRDRPAAVALVPGLFLLVPGSAGFRGLVGMLSSDVSGGLDGAVRAGITAMGIAAGVIVANILLPPRRPL